MPILGQLESMRRRKRSERLLRERGVPVNPTLPVIEASSEARVRPIQEVAQRTVALLQVASAAIQSSQESGSPSSYVDVAPFPFTRAELAFINSDPTDETTAIQFSWRFEAAWALLWALRLVDVLDAPASTCDVDHALTVAKNLDPARPHVGCAMRSPAEILDQVDLVYRYHWAVRNAAIAGHAPPAHVHPGVVQERHHALNWLIRYLDQDWDDITTDT